MNTFAVTEADLHAYVDELLPLGRRADVEAYLASRPDEMARLQSYVAQNNALRAKFNPVLTEPLSPQLMHLTHAPHQSTRAWLRLVAGLAVAVVAGSGGWLLRGASMDGEASGNYAMATGQSNQGMRLLAHEAAIAHVVYSPDTGHPVEIGADQEEQLVAWLTKRIGSNVHPPKLGKLGYELIGGRLLPGQRGPVAQFMYHDAAGQRLTLYVSTEQTQNKNTGFRFAEEGPVNVFYWIDGKFGYALSAGTDKATLARIATSVYSQLQKTTS